jgi:hypothetical protein
MTAQALQLARWIAAGPVKTGGGRLRAARAPLLGAALWCVSCASPGAESAAPPGSAPEPAPDTYIERVAVRDAFRDTYLMHWPRRKMPLSVYLPPPPDGLFPDPDAVLEAVRSAVLEWTDVAGPGVPSFHFVDAHGEADIPVLWAEEPDGDWYIAFCSYHANPRRNLFDVEQVLVTGRWRDGRVAEVEEIYLATLHEMGHALGLMGHSDDENDIMYPRAAFRAEGLSERDRNTLRELYARGNRQIRGSRGRPGP